MRSTIVRAFSLKRRIAQRHMQKGNALEAAEKRVDALLRERTAAPAAEAAKGTGKAGAPGDAGWSQVLFANRGLKWAGASWLVSCSVVAFLMYNRPDEGELDILNRDFRSVLKEVEAERERSGGKEPEDPQLRRWENHYRRVHSEEKLVLPPWKVHRLEKMKGWTWEITDEPRKGLESARNPVRKQDAVTTGAASLAEQLSDVIARFRGA